MIGRTIAHYRITEKLGEGGMGEVYRAHDTKLNRDVALKILPEVFAQDSERMARFEREAQVLASLNHSNIAQIHGLEETDGTKALVLELVEGETLADQIARGPISVDDALKIALQICEGLEAAHEKGIVHRDLKPANIKITPEGQVKILDFGLAKALEDPVTSHQSQVTDFSHSPTLTEEMTRAGVILGTASYMSPEQARGKPVDKRTDIWAFGSVLYEMLTGKKAFGGEGSEETVSDVLAAVLKSEPDWTVLPKAIPATIERTLRRTLRKDTTSRLRDIGDVRIELAEADSESEQEVPRVPHYALSKVIGIALVGILIGALVATLILRHSSPAKRVVPAPVLRMTLPLPPTAPLYTAMESKKISLSPDGTNLLYVAEMGETGDSQLVRLPLDGSDASEIAGSEQALGAFYSPNGQSFGFMKLTGGLYSVLLKEKQEPLFVCAATQPCGASWGPDDWITLPANEYWGLSRVPASGGELERISNYSGLAAHPEILPDGETVLFSSESALSVLSPNRGTLRTLPIAGMLAGVGSAKYVSTGHLVYGQFGRLMAVAFDLDLREVTGSPVPVLDGVRTESLYAASNFDIAENGTLVWLAGGSMAHGNLVWVGGDGSVEPLPFDPDNHIYFRLSPDGSKVAVTLLRNKLDIFIYDLETATRARFTWEGNNAAPVWSPDGKRIAFASDRDGGWAIYVKPEGNDDPDAAECINTSDVFVEPAEWSPDGERLAYVEHRSSTLSDIGLVSLEGDPASEIVVSTPYADTSPTFSPDSRHVAYFSGGAGIYVQSLHHGEKHLITNRWGEVVWSRDGNELYFRPTDKNTQIWVVSLQVEPELKLGEPRMVAELPSFTDTWALSFNVSPDATRFLMQRKNQAPEMRTQIEVIVNWFDKLKRLVPTE